MSVSWIERLWYEAHPAHRVLLPLSWLFGAIAAVRRAAYRVGLLRQARLPVPVIVVGNISVGGVGKTPVVIDLVQRLAADGWRPGVVSRGYGGRARRPTPVNASSDPRQVGDEPVLIAMEAQCPVVVAPNRVQAARLLLAQGVNIIVADDGLQHYALGRDLEIVVVDGHRRHGNACLLPAGPLREPPERIRQADLCLVNGQALAGEFGLDSGLGPAVNLLNGERRVLAEFAEVHALAGIGRPERFFQALEAQGLRLQRHVFPDHHDYRPQDLMLPGSLPILMTPKDAVKCRRFRDRRCWSVSYSSRMPDEAWRALQARLPAPPQVANKRRI